MRDSLPVFVGFFPSAYQNLDPHVSDFVAQFDALAVALAPIHETRCAAWARACACSYEAIALTTIRQAKGYIPAFEARALVHYEQPPGNRVTFTGYIPQKRLSYEVILVL